jgi:hypothetical protein
MERTEVPLMAKKKSDVVVMIDSIKEMGKELGVDLKFEPDKSLRGYRKGAQLKMGDLKKKAAEKAPVWVYYKEHGEEQPRIDNAEWVDVERQSFIFSDGTSFGSDMDIGPDDAPAVDPKCGEGHFEVFEAIKMTKKEIEGKKKVMKLLRDIRKKLKAERKRR